MFPGDTESSIICSRLVNGERCVDPLRQMVADGDFTGCLSHVQAGRHH